jgi:hypothetical protein
MSDNELIAEFMGWICHEANTSYNHPRWYSPDSKDGRRKGTFKGYTHQLMFNSKWDWLMPVVEKIQNMPSPNVEYSNHRNQLMGITIGAPIRVIYSEVVKFIKWYKSVQQ